MYSLLAYCYYQLDDFVNAADCYEKLTILHPDIDDYRLYYAQALYKANLYDEAMKVSSQIDNPAYQLQVGLYPSQHNCHIYHSDTAVIVNVGAISVLLLFVCLFA